MIKRLKSLLLENRGTKQTVAKNVFWIGAGNLAGRFIRAIFVVYAARILGAADYGIFSYALGLAAFFTVFGDLGIGAVVTREIAKKIEDENSYFGTAFIVKIILSFFSAALLMFVTPYFSNVPQANILLPLAALLIIADNLREFCSSFFRAKERMEFEAISILTTNVAITAGGLAILYYVPSLPWLMTTYTAGAAIGMVAALWMLRKPLLNGIRRFNPKLLRPMLIAAIPFSLTGILGGLLLNTDMMVLGWLRTAEDIGLYAAGQKIVYILYILPGIFVSAIFPPLARYIEEKNHEGAKLILQKGTRILSAIALPITTGGIILAAPIIQFLFGGEYLAGTLSFQILMATILFVFPTSLYGSFLFADNKQNTMAALSALMALGNLVFDIFFIHWWGFVGSSVATLVMQIIYWILVVRLVKKHTPFSAWKGSGRIVIATCVMSLAVIILMWMHLPLLLAIFVAFCLYIGMLYWTKEPLLSEVMELLRGAKTPKTGSESHIA